MPSRKLRRENRGLRGLCGLCGRGDSPAKAAPKANINKIRVDMNLVTIRQTGAKPCLFRLQTRAESFHPEESSGMNWSSLTQRWLGVGQNV